MNETCFCEIQINNLANIIMNFESAFESKIIYLNVWSKGSSNDSVIVTCS